MNRGKLGAGSEGVRAMFKQIIVAALAGAAMAGWNEAVAAESSSLAVLTNRLAKLEAEVQALKTQNVNHNYRVQALEGAGTESLTPEDGHYTVLHTRFGVMLISYETAAPYLDGYEVTVAIGNLTTASFKGLKVALDYGPALVTNASGQPQYTAYFSSRKHKDFNLLDVISSGKWNNIKLQLVPAKAEEVRDLDIRLEFDNVFLSKPVSN